MVEDFKGFPLGFLFCNNCAMEAEKLKFIQSGKIIMMESRHTVRTKKSFIKERKLSVEKGQKHTGKSRIVPLSAN